jgi:hypothetical protein
MKCEECELLLAGGEAEASVEDHVRGCSKCRAIREELRANALALSSLRDDELPRVTMPVRRPVRWIAAAAAAVLLALMARQGLQRQSPHPLQVTAPVTGPMRVTAKLPSQLTPQLAVRREPKAARRAVHPEQPMLVKMLTPDPDVVVYWIVD